MQSDFEKSAAAIQFWEAGLYTDNPDDPGGATKWGITLTTLRTVKPNATKVDVRNLSWTEAKQIYYNAFWLHNKCDKLPAGLALAVFDGCVNQSEDNVHRFLQTALKIHPVDGIIGYATLNAAAKCDEKAVLMEFMALRAQRYATRNNVGVFGHGWFRRMFDMDRRCLELINTSKGD